METETMGRCAVEATIENLQDLLDIERGTYSSRIKAVELLSPDALVDTGANMLSLPTHIINKLGLKKRSDRGVLQLAKESPKQTFTPPVRLTIKGRDCPMDVLEVPMTFPCSSVRFLGVHGFRRRMCPTRTLIGNPAHGGRSRCMNFIKLPKGRVFF